MIVEPCERCEGAGSVEIERAYDVTIPAGVSDGSTRRVAGEEQPRPLDGGAQALDRARKIPGFCCRAPGGPALRCYS